MPEIEINPTTRIEGHHSTTIDVRDGTIQSAKSHMEMFRGIENITIGRPPSDVPQVTQMVCGVCFTSHRQGAILAIEDAAKRAGVFDGVPRNARLLQNVMEGMFLLWNHAVHLFTLAGPDYSDAIADSGYERLDPGSGEGYTNALEVQRTLLQAFTEFGGRAPHPLTYAPGGVAASPDEQTVESVRERIEAVSEWLGPTDKVPEVRVDAFEQYPVREDAVGIYDILCLIAAAVENDADEVGVGPNRFYANGMFYKSEDEWVLPSGTYIDGSLRTLTRTELVNGITEDTTRSWYTDESGGSPREAPPPEVAPEKENAYSWGKAPRFNDLTMETGPIARLIAAERDPFDLRERYGGGPRESNNLNRLIARGQEMLIVRDMLLDWIDQVNVDGRMRADWTDDFSGQGIGLWGAPRGALSHWVKIENGEVTQYQIIAPTLWNLGPRDGNGQPSILEEALEGMTVENVNNPIEVMQTIRSFDPCLGCSVQVESPEAQFTETIDPPPGPVANMVGRD